MKLSILFFRASIVILILFSASLTIAQSKYYAIVEYCSNRDAFDKENTQVYYLSKPIDITAIKDKYEKSTDKYKDQKFYASIWKLFKLKLYAQYKVEVNYDAHGASSSTHTMWYEGVEYIYSDNISPKWKGRMTTIGQDGVWWTLDVAEKYFSYAIDEINLEANHVLKIVN